MAKGVSNGIGTTASDPSLVGDVSLTPPTADAAERAGAYLASIESEKVRREIEKLASLHVLDLETLFPRTTGMGAAGDVKRRVRMLQSVEPRMAVLLYPDERVQFVTKGVLSSFVEQYFMGIWSIIINRTVFLFTNYRLILLNADSKGRVKTMMWHVPYHRIRKFGTVGSMKIRIEGVGKLTFAGVPRRDRKALKAFVREHLDEVRQTGFEFPTHAGRDPLCPTCATPQPPRARACVECGEQFINPARPALMSLVLPGLGDLYLGHRLPAMFELVGFAVLIVVGTTATLNQPSQLPFYLIVIAIANTIDAVLTRHVAMKGLLPVSHAWGKKPQHARP